MALLYCHFPEGVAGFWFSAMDHRLPSTTLAVLSTIGHSGYPWQFLGSTMVNIGWYWEFSTIICYDGATTRMAWQDFKSRPIALDPEDRCSIWGSCIFIRWNNLESVSSYWITGPCCSSNQLLWQSKYCLHVPTQDPVIHSQTKHVKRRIITIMRSCWVNPRLGLVYHNMNEKIAFIIYWASWLGNTSFSVSVTKLVLYCNYKRCVLSFMQYYHVFVYY